MRFVLTIFSGLLITAALGSNVPAQKKDAKLAGLQKVAADAVAKTGAADKALAARIRPASPLFPTSLRSLSTST